MCPPASELNVAEEGKQRRNGKIKLSPQKELQGERRAVGSSLFLSHYHSSIVLIARREPRWIISQIPCWPCEPLNTLFFVKELGYNLCRCYTRLPFVWGLKILILDNETQLSFPTAQLHSWQIQTLHWFNSQQKKNHTCKQVTCQYSMKQIELIRKWLGTFKHLKLRPCWISCAVKYIWDVP